MRRNWRAGSEPPCEPAAAAPVPLADIRLQRRGGELRYLAHPAARRLPHTHLALLDFLKSYLNQLGKNSILRSINIQASAMESISESFSPAETYFVDIRLLLQ